MIVNVLVPMVLDENQRKGTMLCLMEKGVINDNLHEFFYSSDSHICAWIFSNVIFGVVAGGACERYSATSNSNDASMKCADSI